LGEAAWEVREGTERSTGDVTPRVAVKGTEELFRRKGGSEVRGVGEGGRN